jgi:haloalkane dehalogenase
MIRFIEKIQLNHINLFAQDWGGIIGLRLVTSIGDRFAKVAISNTTIPGMFPPKHKNLKFHHKIIPFLNTTFGFGGWYLFSQLVPIFTASSIINKGTIGKISKEVRRAYDAPFPDKRYKAGARVFPTLVQSQPKQGKAAWEQISKWKKPFLTLFSNMDYILGGHDVYFRKMVPGAQDINHKKIEYAGHFCQEDKGEKIAGLLVTFYDTGNIY